MPANAVLQESIAWLLRRPVGRPPQEVRRYVTWAFSVRLDGRDGLNRYLKESPADVQAVNIIGLYPQPLKVMTHDHVDQLG